MARREVEALDQALDETGEDVVLRRIYGLSPRTNYVDVTLRAVVRTYQPRELLGGINQTDNKVIISPTGIAKAGWPGGEAPSLTVADPALPRNTDHIFIQGRSRTISVVQPIYVDNELVRIEIRVQG